MTQATVVPYTLKSRTPTKVRPVASPPSPKAVSPSAVVRSPGLVAPGALSAALGLGGEAPPNAVLPSLELCTVDWQGSKGDGKTTAAFGNPWGLALKFVDGPFIRTRCAAEVRLIRGIEDFNARIEEALRIAEHDGPNGRFRTLIIDPTFMWQGVLADRYLSEVNRIQRDRSKPNEELPLYRSIREHPDGAKKYFPMIAEDISSTIQRFTSCGWGVHTCTHYKRGLIIEGDSMSSARSGWVPDVAQGVAGAIDKLMVLRAVCEVVQVEKLRLYDVSFSSTKFSGAGSSRVPLLGDIELPNYADPKTPPGATSFMTIRAAVAKAAEAAYAAESAFQAHISEHPLTEGA